MVPFPPCGPSYLGLLACLDFDPCLLFLFLSLSLGKRLFTTIVGERLEFEALLWFSCFQLLSVNHMFSVFGFFSAYHMLPALGFFHCANNMPQLWASLCHMVKLKLVEIWYLHLLQ